MSIFGKNDCGNCAAYAAHDESGHLGPFRITRTDPGKTEVELRIQFCGICHSDLHMIRNEWHNTTYPVTPGHEIVGYVTRVGSEVKDFSEGDLIGVGCMIGSCKVEGSPCTFCADDHEQLCKKCVLTYNSQLPDGRGVSAGGYSTRMVVDRQFCLRVPTNLPLEGVAPLLCAGITVWTPMKEHKFMSPGFRLGVIGLGGLGHMAVKFGKALGQEVTVISTSPSKEEAARSGLGADRFICSKDDAAMQSAAESLDGIIDTVSAQHDLSPYLGLLKPFGKLVLLGVSPTALTFQAGALAMRHRSVVGSLIGGIKDTQEMLDFCGEKNVVSDVEVISIKTVNEAMERMVKSDVKYRFVLDIARTLKDE